MRSIPVGRQVDTRTILKKISQEDSHQHDARPPHDRCESRRVAWTAFQLCTLFLYSHFLQQTENVLLPLETGS